MELETKFESTISFGMYCLGILISCGIHLVVGVSLYFWYFNTSFIISLLLATSLISTGMLVSFMFYKEEIELLCNELITENIKMKMKIDPNLEPSKISSLAFNEDFDVNCNISEDFDVTCKLSKNKKDYFNDE
tara:strand:- start:24 stop:422 length:399 start_codon:yes stop_codon:yes gene_type:complete